MLMNQLHKSNPQAYNMVTNAMRSGKNPKDIVNTMLKQNNMPVDKFCFVMAKSFINDVDANKYKVEKYFTETI